jgi:hypothetical protein
LTALQDICPKTASHLSKSSEESVFSTYNKEDFTMENNNNTTTNTLSEEILKEVSGGYIGPNDYVSPEIENSSFYSSGDTPKYCVGQRVGLKFCVNSAAGKAGAAIAACSVVGISETKNCGTFCKEFSYTVELLENVGRANIGSQYDGIYESCLYEI